MTEREDLFLARVKEKDLLTLLTDGPTLHEVAERVAQQSREEVSLRSVGEMLVDLQNQGYVFLEEGRWWRTPEGITFLEASAEESAEVSLKIFREMQRKLLHTVSLCTHSIYYVDVLAIVAAATIFMWSAIFAPGSSTFGGDVLSFWTFLDYVARDTILRFGEVPLWNPYYFSGMPYLANPQTSPFYFSTPLILLLGEVDGIRWTVILHVLLSGLNMYYLMSTLKQKRLASILAAIGYMFSGYMTARIAIGHLTFVHGYSWAPMAFAFCEKAITTRKLRYGALTGVVLMLQFQSGALIILAYTSLVLALYLTYQCIGCYWNHRTLSTRSTESQWHRSRLRSTLTPVFNSASVAIVIALTFSSLSAIKLIPMIEFISQTRRIAERGGIIGGVPGFQAISSVLFERNVQTYNNVYGYGWWEFSAYLGWMVLLGIAALLIKWRSKHTIFFGLVSFIGIVAAMGEYSPCSALLKYMYDNVPFFSALLHLPARFLFLTVFSIPVLSGMTISAVLEKLARLKTKRLIHSGQFVTFIIVIAVILDMGFFSAPHLTTVSVASTPPYTSLAPSDLSVRWLEYPVNIRARTGEPLKLYVKLKNTGDTIWLRQSRQPFSPWDPSYQVKGTVNLSVIVSNSDYRCPLPKDVNPGDEVELTVTVPGRKEPGKSTLEINLVAEFVTWFNPPHPLGTLTVDTSFEKTIITTAQTPIDSYSQSHVFMWISAQSPNRYFRIGPYTTWEGGLTQMAKLGLFHVGGYETGQILLANYDRFAFNLSHRDLGLLNVKYLILNQESSSKSLHLVYRAEPWFVYENKDFLPRAFFVDSAILMIGTDERFFEVQDRLMNADNFDPGRVTVIQGPSLRAESYDSVFLKRFGLVIVLPWGAETEEKMLMEKCRQANVPAVEYREGSERILMESVVSIKGGICNPPEIVHYSPNRIVVKVGNDKPGFLVLSEAYFPGWKAYVNEKEVPVTSAYFVLRSIFLDKPGEHEVLFAYAPMTYVAGTTITVTASLLIIVIMFRGRLASLLFKRKRSIMALTEDSKRAERTSRHRILVHNRAPAEHLIRKLVGAST
jgi:hypothetical protein